MVSNWWARSTFASWKKGGRGWRWGLKVGRKVEMVDVLVVYKLCARSGRPFRPHPPHWQQRRWRSVHFDDEVIIEIAADSVVIAWSDWRRELLKLRKSQEKTQVIVLHLLQCNQLVCKEIVIVSHICQGAMTHKQNLSCCLVVVSYHCCLKKCLFDGYGWWWAPSQKVPNMVRARKYDGTPWVLTILLLGSDFADNLVVVPQPFPTWLREFQIPVLDAIG